MNEWERLSRKAKMLKQCYPEGTVVQLGFMEGEPDMPTGLRDKVILVDANGSITQM